MRRLGIMTGRQITYMLAVLCAIDRPLPDPIDPVSNEPDPKLVMAGMPRSVRTTS